MPLSIRRPVLFHRFVPFAAAWALALAGCATDADVRPRNGVIDFHIAAGNAGFTTRLGADSLVWNLDAALATVGEIGIHWERLLAKPAHDVPGGRPSPKIYEYFAVDLLRTQALQTIAVPAAIYDHVHMIFRPASETTRGIDSLPALLGHSLYFSGTVTDGIDTLPFRVEIDSTYRENDLGDAVFSLQVLADQRYRMFLAPELDLWFSGILRGDLVPTAGDTVVIRHDNANRPAALKLETRYTLDNAFGVMVEAHAP